MMHILLMRTLRDDVFGFWTVKTKQDIKRHQLVLGQIEWTLLTIFCHFIDYLPHRLIEEILFRLISLVSITWNPITLIITVTAAKPARVLTIPRKYREL